MRPVALTTRRLRLREFDVADALALHRVYGDAEATRHLSFEPRSYDDVELLVKRIVSDSHVQPRLEYALAVEESPSLEVIGMARLAVSTSGCGQVGFALRPDRWRQGLGTEAVQALLDFGFGQLGLHRIWGARSPANVASARLMTAIGMAEEGRIANHVYVRGGWRDSVVHAILDSQWRGETP